VSPNGGLKAAPSPPQKQHSEHTRQKEVDSTGWQYALTCELDLLCTAVVAVCRTRYELNLFFGENKKDVKKKREQKLRKDSI
jgi:hypothetical protein